MFLLTTFYRVTFPLKHLKNTLVCMKRTFTWHELLHELKFLHEIYFIWKVYIEIIWNLIIEITGL